MVELTPGSNIDLGEVVTKIRADPVIMLRSAAVNNYAVLEQSLCRLFSFLLGAQEDRATIVFYRIVNTKSRNTIISKLMQRQFRDEIHLFWNSSLKLLRSLDERRNQIIHWHVVTNIQSTDDGNNSAHLTLNPPESLGSTEPLTQQPLGEDQLVEFIRRADFMARLLNMFCFHHVSGPLEEPWPEIFRQAVVYPAPPDHPLNNP
jgi:hypothetical protein